MYHNHVLAMKKNIQVNITNISIIYNFGVFSKTTYLPVQRSDRCSMVFSVQNDTL